MKKYMTSLGVRKWSLVTFLFILFTHVGNSLRPYQFTSHGKGDYRDGEGNMHLKAGAKGEVGMELYPTGSNLPDCSHACGPCFPCKRVMVSFKCAVESCPVVYRCMCKGKYYHVPSN